jgi:hypothetical protein
MSSEKMAPFSVNHLNETEFEEFCFALLVELGFTNLQWRKGTGLESSPSDRGRDIECQLELTDIDGNKHFETWFVECKHHIKGVPPSQIQGALAWATAERPNTLLVIASNFLSNPAKDSLKIYETQNRPHFKIKVWERPDLEKLTLGRSRLLRKYRVTGEFPFLTILHPAHILYLKEPQLNTIGYLFETLDRLDPEKRDPILSWIYEPIIKPRYREPTTGKETINELRIDKLSYETFKSKCYEIVRTGTIDGPLLVFLIVNFVLQWQLGISDVTSVDEFIYRMRDAVKFFQGQMEEKPEERDELEAIIRHTEERIQHAYENTEQNYHSYELFCTEVVGALLLEDIFRGAAATPEP